MKFWIPSAPGQRFKRLRAWLNIRRQGKAWIVFVLTASAGALAIALTLLAHHHEEDTVAQRQFSAQMEWLTLITANELQKSDYDHLRQFLLAWANKEPDVVKLSVTTRNGFEVLNFARPDKVATEALVQSTTIQYGIDNEAVLSFAFVPGENYHVASSVARRIALLFVVFVGLAAILLRQKILRQDEAETLRRRTEELLRTKEQIGFLEEKYRRILESCAEGIFGFDQSGRCTFINPAAGKMLGLESPEALLGCNIHEAIHHSRADGSDYPEDECLSFRAMRLGESVHVDDEVYWRADRTAFPVEYRSVPITKEGVTIGGVTTFDDITARKATEKELLKLQRAVEQSPVAIIITDLTGTIDYVNPCFEKNTGYTRDEVVGRNVRMLKSDKNGPSIYSDLWKTISSGQNWTGEFCSQRKDGSYFWERAFMSPVKSPEGIVTHYLAIKEDVTRERELAEKIRYQAEYDALTGIPNRMLTLDRLAQSIAHARRSGNRVALLFIDLDNFKMVNDTLGHDTGDRLLVEASERFRSVIRESDTVGRHGGDEFLIVIESVAQLDAAERVARDVLNCFNRPFVLGTVELQVSPSIGVAVFPDDGADSATLLRNADVAMYAAKESGRNTYRFFLPEMNHAASERMEIDRHLAVALDNSELSLEFQPQIDLATGRVIGAEALLRWDNPTLGVISPDRFIPVAEQSGMITAMGAWVMEVACWNLRQWIDAGHTGLHIAVNVSPRQFRVGDRDGDILALVDRLLTRYALPPKSLELEITEGLLIHPHGEVRQTLIALHGRGIRLAMDDFGTGYSSLAYLRELPFDVVKIDRSFIRDIAKDPEDRSLVQAILSMANSLGMSTIAEGVEEVEQLDFLRQHGCQIVQGYYYGRPMTAERFGRFLETFSITPPVKPN